MKIIKKYINNRYYVFEQNENIVIIPVLMCVSRDITTQKCIKIDKLNILNIPLGLSLWAIRSGFKVLVTDGNNIYLIENYKISKDLLLFISENWNKINEFYKNN